METHTFCRGVLRERKEHHEDAEWLKDVKKELEQDEGQDKFDIAKDKMMGVMRKMPNFKSSRSWQCPRLLVKEFDSIT